MARALALAAKGEGYVSPNPMVGCVIVHPKHGIVGEGWHRQYGGPHAEVNAVSSMRNPELLSECTVYVTLEPCAHRGKTPPCADMLISKGARKVVIGSVDPFAKVDGKGIKKLREAGCEVLTGFMRDECDALNRKFMTAHRLSRPYVMLKWAMTSDGFIASENGEPIKISNQLSSVYMHALRSGFDAIMVGTNTVLCDNPELTVRLWPVRKNPRAVTFDIHDRLQQAAENRVVAILQRDDTIVIKQPLALPELLHNLYALHGITSLLVEGGTRLLQSFLDIELYDDVRIEVSDMKSGKGVKAPVFEKFETIARNSDRVRNNLIFSTFTQ